jgi:hypothetical protein
MESILLFGWQPIAPIAGRRWKTSIKIAEDKGLPDVIAFVMNNKEQRDDFIFEFEPAFEIYQIKDDDYWRLLGDGEIPRIILINDGIVIKKWDLTPA